MSQSETKRSGAKGAAWKRKPRGPVARRSRRERSSRVETYRIPELERTNKVASREIEDYLCATFGIQKEAAGRVWDSILERLRTSLLQGRPVTLTNIGTLDPYVKQASNFRHPESGKMHEVPARRYVRFLLSPSLKTELRVS